MENSVKVRDSFVVNALRNCGYTPYSAIADILDNSIEKDVEAKNVRVKFITERDRTNTKIKEIYIIDDGNGMTKETLEEAMYFGSETGKDPEMDLGMYGAGLKTSALSMGRTLTVLTKTKESDNVLSTFISVSSFYDGSPKKRVMSLDKPVEHPFGTEEYDKFKSLTGADHGTVVMITELDKFPSYYVNAKNYLKKELGKTFNKFISNGAVKFFVDNDEVLAIDPMGTCKELLGSGSFNVLGHEVRYNAYFVESTRIAEDSIDSEQEFDNTEMSKQGFYIYRNDRLVGEHLSICYAKHPTTRNFRCEVFVDGTCDGLFGSNFTKTITEYSRASIVQELRDKLSNTVGTFVRVCKARDKKSREEKKKDPETIRRNKEFYDGVTDKQNRNRFLKGTRKGINVKHENEEKEEKEHTVRGKQKNPNPVRTRKDVWLGGFEEMPLGRRGNIVEFDLKNARPVVIINNEHPFYEEIYSNLPNEVKAKMAQAISCIEIARQEANYYADIDVQRSVDEFLLVLSNEVAKSLER